MRVHLLEVVLRGEQCQAKGVGYCKNYLLEIPLSLELFSTLYVKLNFITGHGSIFAEAHLKHHCNKADQ